MSGKRQDLINFKKGKVARAIYRGKVSEEIIGFDNSRFKANAAHCSKWLNLNLNKIMAEEKKEARDPTLLKSL